MDFHECLLWLKGIEILKGDYSVKDLQAEINTRGSDLADLFKKYKPAIRA